MKNSLVGLFACYTFIVICASPLKADSIEDIVHVWQARQDYFQSVRFEIDGTIFKPKAFTMVMPHSADGGGPLPVPAEDHLTEVKLEGLFDLKNGRAWQHRVDERFELDVDGRAYVYFPEEQTAVFDAGFYYFYHPYDLNDAKSPKPGIKGIELGIYKRQRLLFDTLNHLPVRYAVGMIHTEVDYETANMKPELDPLDFRLGGKTEVEGHNCVVVRTVPSSKGRYFELWVDEQDPRIIRQVQIFGVVQKRALWALLKIHYQDSDDGPIPKSWTTEMPNTEGKVAVRTLQLRDFEANPTVADEDFVISPPPGTIAYDERLPEDARGYVIGEAGKLKIPIEEYRMQQDENRSRYWLYVSIAGVGVVLAGAVFLYRRQANAA